jgi:MFS family permease
LASHVIATPRAGVAPLERWYVLIVMCLVYAINIAARYVVTTVFEPIRLELALSDAGAAFLTGVPLALFYVVCGIHSHRCRLDRHPAAASRSGSRHRNQSVSGHRPRPSLSGEAYTSSTPSSTSIVSDCFPAERRPMALSVFALGAPIGAWLGADLAGAVAQAHGWRAAFFALGAPGVLLGLLVFLTIREPRRGQLDAMAAERRASFSESLAFLWRQRAAFHVIMGSGVCSLWGWGLVWWTPTFLLRTYGLNVAQAGALTGHIHLVGGLLATASAAWFMSRPNMLDARRVLWMLGLVIGCATVPSFIAYWTHSLWVARLMFWAYIPAIYFFIGPCMALVLNLAPPHMRSTFTAWSVLVGNVFNLIVAPQFVGILSDWFGGAHGSDAASLRWALLVLAPTGFWAAWHFFLAARTVAPDMQRAAGYGSA